MDNYLSEERFNKWVADDFKPVKDRVASLPCDVAALRVDSLKEDVDDVSLKIDYVIGNNIEDNTQRSSINGKLSVLIPLVIANLSTLIGVLLYLLKNGAG